ncbi:beta-ketoacyl synthase N-terminal-like domain-containing protein [Nostoc sp. UHCC 0252]|uniref:hotdog fold thioesterase n=1 Tax=Nostoc sp. UHCC 0252 TaxID=3110241 RepID=UPI002B202BFA|nr:beta-ketoacyl synthase N-terminal-like domain-containing protein [Nostoc sp. UHCC 0252]MEA5605292.1 beta-ketoacyl synthase N-terminal-like domain-containing protein [Nostoc sp. UHCC 0252]
MSEIAIIGIGCLFPEAKNPAEFWDILMAGRDVTSELTPEDLSGKNPSIFYHSEVGTPDKICYTKHGYLRGFKFDPHGYRTPAEKLNQLDRIYHFCLYAAKEALKDSGYGDKEQILSQTGLILGNLSFGTEYSSRLFSAMHLQALEFFVKKLLRFPNFSFKSPLENLQIAPENAITASGPTDVVCKSLGLGGTRFAIDAACATSLYAMELAAYYLNTGQAKMMLAGAVCSPERLHVLHGFNVLHAFPGQGKSIPLDKSSEGIKIGEGAGIFVLKRLCDAQKDGDRIYAVIENIGLSNDGAGKHILNPSQKGQYLALERAYRQTPLADYIECHATGTAVGDKTELNTLEKFFQAKKTTAKVGANKANFGHLLTASGMVSLIKGIWVIKTGTIPPTIAIKEAIASDQGSITTAQILQTPTPWPQNHQPKRVGINAFGFGGTNAHLILREYNPEILQATSENHIQQTSALAIIGMDIHVGSVEGIQAFSQALYTQQELKQVLPPCRWIGAEDTLDELPPPGVYLEKFDLDCLRYKVPPNQVSSLLFDHLLMMKIADGALHDAGFKKEERFSNTAVIVAMEMNLTAHRSITRLNMPWYVRESVQRLKLDLTPEQIDTLESLLKGSISPSFYLEGITGGIGNLAASRIASLWNFTGPALTVSAQEGSVPKAIEIAKFLLELGKVDAVVVGAIDQAGGWEQVQWRKNSYSLNNSVTFGEGAAAVVFKKANEADELGHKIYATIEALAIQSHQNNSVAQAAKQALAQAQISPENVGYLEVSQNPLAPQNEQEITQLNQLYSLSTQSVGSVKNSIGNTFVLSSLCSLIKTSLMLYHRRLPNHQSQSFAAINEVSQDGSSAHLILQASHYQAFVADSKEPVSKTFTQQLFKTIYSGSTRMETILSKTANFPELKLQPVQTNKPPLIVATNNESTTYSHLSRKQTIFNQQSIINKELEILFLQVQEAFYQNLSNQLASNKVFMPTLLVEEKLSPDLPKEQGNLIDSLLSPAIAVSQLKSNQQIQKNVWDFQQILEMSAGKVASVLGDYYQEVDTYPIRTRLPLPPFMFVSRVTKMTAIRGKLEPCYIEWEYDIPADTFFAAHQVLTGIIPFEASHVLLLALSYIGCDLIFKGKLRYRAIDSEVEVLGELPQAGETIRGEVFINKIIKTNKIILLQYTYNCYHRDQQLLRINANSGYFSETDLQKPKGLPEFKISPTENINITTFSPPLICDKDYFQDEDIKALQAGNFADCFGSAYQLANPIDQLLSSHQLLMINRILKVERAGGLWQLGKIVGEVDINPEHWVFKAHFKNDPVMPGTMLVEGCNQVALFYMYYLGLHTQFQQFKATWVPHIGKSKAKFRGEVKPKHSKVQFRVTVKEINSSHQPYIIVVAEILLDGTIIGICENLAVKMQAYN